MTIQERLLAVSKIPRDMDVYNPQGYGFLQISLKHIPRKKKIQSDFSILISTIINSRTYNGCKATTKREMVECKFVQWILLTNETQNIFLSEVFHKNTKNSGRNFYSYYFVQFQERISSIHLIESCISLNCYLPKQIAIILRFYNTRKKRNSYCSFAICSSRYRLPLNN